MTATVTPIETHIAQIRREAAAAALTIEAEFIQNAPAAHEPMARHNAHIAKQMLKRAQQYQTGELTL